MKILLTGASSFSGFWFARALSEAGHDVVAPLRRAEASYIGDVRARRVQLLTKCARVIGPCEFGSDAFFDLIGSQPWDLLCHHAAYVEDYRSPSFNVAQALAQNTYRLPDLLTEMANKGMRAVVLTGSVFEQNEGSGTAPLRAFSPYGLSKGFTAETFTYWCRELTLPLRKFVIPNPFGPLEEPRFCAYLIKCWKDAKTAEVRTPRYVRDNVPVDLLARCYAQYCAEAAREMTPSKRNPSCYVETQGAFTSRFSREIEKRLRIPCPYVLLNQTDNQEPFARINTESALQFVPDWDETQSWDNIAAYYAES